MALVLIKKGADLEQADHMNMSAVHYASKEGMPTYLKAKEKLWLEGTCVCSPVHLKSVLVRSSSFS